jgi:Bacterial Ig-like domain
MKRLYAQFVVVAVGCIALQCSDPGAVAPDDPNVDSTPLKGMVISNPHSVVANTASVSASSSAEDDEVVYVSLAPKTLPTAVRIEIGNRNRNLPASLVSVIDGGFDPVAVQASAGDTLDLIAWMLDGRTTSMAIKVPAERPPSVVRSKPDKGLTDVALNVVITVVFTEPIDQRSVTSNSVQLSHAGRPVRGKFVFQSTSWDVQFVPESALDPNSEYDLVVTTDIRDLDGEQLDASFSSSFVTGASYCNELSAQLGCLGIGENLISGTVTERTIEYGVRPVSNAIVSAWVQLSDKTGFSPVSVQTDERGEYTIRSLPHATVLLHATLPGFDQPCVAAVNLSSASATGNIQVVRTTKAVMDTTTSLPRIWGLVYELVPIVDPFASFELKGIPGARVYLESSGGFVLASTTADDIGHYAFCNLPLFTELRTYGVKTGFVPVAAPIAAPPTVTLTSLVSRLHDIEMKR